MASKDIYSNHEAKVKKKKMILHNFRPATLHGPQSTRKAPTIIFLGKCFQTFTSQIENYIKGRRLHSQDTNSKETQESATLTLSDTPSLLGVASSIVAADEMCVRVCVREGGVKG